MKRTMSTMPYLAAAALLAAGLAGTAHAAIPAGQGPAATSGAKAAPTAQRRAAAHHRATWLMGNIIETKKDSLAINTENGRMRTLKLSRRTDIVVDGKRASASDLKPGAPVMASYEGTGAHATARIVTVDERASSAAPTSTQGASSGQPRSGERTR